MLASVGKTILLGLALASAGVQACGQVQCSGGHGYDYNGNGYTGNTFRIEFNQIDAGRNSNACGQFDKCMREQAPSRGISYRGTSCAFPSNAQGDFVATVSVDKQSPGTQEELILECMSAVIEGGCITNAGACSCNGC
ncbi:hypothetical protein A1O3_07365 [Capronia epimyces CBS 606.96]|uniref:Uncharacterized protein n=1 Tax=Capronia epimyces CBS 606.96 TaxID=1182542 RepID=W9XKM2_9EURO|nr:uncharacterized protein A1O3_07365 [Capronia epimyces CBS 606.96]EXJ81077.1 hypothetical protein A1O3_07365 [Capronia epimyces CBS 606.96]